MTGFFFTGLSLPGRTDSLPLPATVQAEATICDQLCGWHGAIQGDVGAGTDRGQEWQLPRPHLLLSTVSTPAVKKYCKLVTLCQVFYFIWRTVAFSYSEIKNTVVIKSESFMSLHIFCCFVSRGNIFRVHQQSLVNQILLLKDWVLILMVKSMMIWSLVV